MKKHDDSINQQVFNLEAKSLISPTPSFSFHYF